jgi:phage terminase Nu1 subunit (DNA packaging protein)
VAAHDLEALARAVGKTVRTVQRWRREGCPLPRGRESLRDWAKRVNQWHESKPIAAKRKRKQEAAADEPDWELQGKKALALQRMHRLQIERGESIPRAEVVDEWARRCFAVRTKLLGLPRVLGARCAMAPADVVEAEADAIVRDILSSFEADGANTPSKQPQ